MDSPDLIFTLRKRIVAGTENLNGVLGTARLTMIPVLLTGGHSRACDSLQVGSSSALSCLNPRSLPTERSCLVPPSLAVNLVSVLDLSSGTSKIGLFN